MAQTGPVEHLRRTGSDGAYVVYELKEHAALSVLQWNGKQVDGCDLVVKFSERLYDPDYCVIVQGLKKGVEKYDIATFVTCLDEKAVPRLKVEHLKVGIDKYRPEELFVRVFYRSSQDAKRAHSILNGAFFNDEPVKAFLPPPRSRSPPRSRNHSREREPSKRRARSRERESDERTTRKRERSRSPTRRSSSRRGSHDRSRSRNRRRSDDPRR